LISRGAVLCGATRPEMVWCKDSADECMRETFAGSHGRRAFVWDAAQKLTQDRLIP
jgi:hypothetical protein